MLGSFEQGTLHCRELQDLFIIKSLILRAEDTDDFLSFSFFKFFGNFFFFNF